MFEVGEAYEVIMGRWRRQLAPLFVEFVGVRNGEKVLDVGCGTGALSATVAQVTSASKIVRIDPSKGFVEYARTQISDSRVSFEVGDAQNLPYPNDSFDRAMSLLMVSFVPDATKAAKEMLRVTNTGGVVATANWDLGRANELNGCLWDAAMAIDPTAKRPAARLASYNSGEALSGLLKDAGLTDIEVGDLTMQCQFASFDELWQRYLSGEAASGAYVVSLTENRREALKQRLRQDLLQGNADGPFTLQAKAWAVRGVVP
jgi:ubiquinone/menaquinone biosynthesis C-methylase UbiE